MDTDDFDLAVQYLFWYLFPFRLFLLSNFLTAGLFMFQQTLSSRII